MPKFVWAHAAVTKGEPAGSGELLAGGGGDCRGGGYLAAFFFVP